MIIMILLVCVSLIVLGGASIWLNWNSTNSTLKQTMTETAQIGAQSISNQLLIYKSIAYETGSVARFTNADTTLEKKKEMIDQKVQTYAFQSGNLLNAKGISLFDGNDYSDRDYFEAAIQGKTYVSEPLISKVSGKLSVVIAAPLWQGGIPNSTVAGVVYFIPNEEFLNEIVKSIKVSENSGSFILNDKGTIIAHPNKDYVVNFKNTIEDAKTDDSFKGLAKLEEKMINGESGFGNYRFERVNKFLAYAPIPETNGWSFAVNAETGDFTKKLFAGIIVTIAMLMAGILVAVILARKTANKIVNPIIACVNRLELLADKGDLKSSVPTVTTNDETAVLASATKKLIESTSTIIQDADYLLGEMASGNFAIQPKKTDAYIGDYENLLLSMRKINYQLSDTLSQINEAADQVSVGSDQVSNSAQALSQGAAEQASSVEELAATINEISQHIKINANNAQEANAKANNAGNEAIESNRRMQKMLDAMSEISNSSSEIGKIIKTIEDIAFQTNILALNAAVEAARAGEAGKGFAVVADEVRNLASKSAEASKNTATLIATSLKSVEDGTKIADDTAKSMQTVVEGIKEVALTVDRISNASAEQADSITQVTQGVDQISAVIQTNSATAEESAAASEELSGQAQMLKELIGGFRLRQEELQETIDDLSKEELLPLQSKSMEINQNNLPDTSKY